ncbi:TonB-dependent siderophore receptor [Aquincola sp. J276]|uniref:TonB-dependent receptor plug domain-containing protein n=1 Tax=Aquincola sp. J276 TaxID=2898432 RepID=UPI0021509526|nr:TonB-dependent receptor [Aquincola sp. J276]MCR5868489.1 TonB-dependent receptor [Aquincola sp. J276]
MNVLIDGVSVYRPAFSEVVWLQLPVSIDDIERIEVTRGPSSATYGPNSMLAVVNIITFNASDVGLGHVSMTAGRRLGDEANVRLGLRFESAALTLTASRSVDSGFDWVTQDSAGHDGLAISRLGLRLDATLPSGDVVNARAMLARGVAEVPFIDPFQQSYPDRRFSDSYVSGSWQRDFSPEHQLRVSIDSARQRNRQSWRTCLPTAALLPELFKLWQANPRYANAILAGQVPVGSGGSPRDDQLAVSAIGALHALGPEAALPRCGTTDQDATQFRTDIELQDTLVLSPELRIVTGFGWRHQGGESETYLGGRQTSTVRWLFGNVEARPRPWLTLNVGGYVERNSLAPSSFSPRLAANWHLAPGHTVRASWSKGTRAPDIQEQLTNWTIRFRDVDPPLAASSTARFYQSRIGPRGLSSERIVSREIGYLANLPTWGVILDARVFDDQLTRLISERTNLAGLTPTNAGAVNLRGAEFQISGRLSGEWFGHATYGYLDNRNPTNILERTLWSRHSGSVGVSREFGNGWQLAGSYTGASSTGYQQSRYGRADLVVSKAWKQDQTQWRVTGGLQRLDRPATTYSIGSDTALESRYDGRFKGFLQLAVDLP